MLGALFSLSSAAGCGRAVRRRAASEECSKAAIARDAASAAPFCTDDSIQFAGKGPIIRGKESICKDWEQLFALPGPGLSFRMSAAEVARSGDIAWDYGTYEFAMADKKGKVTTGKGKHMIVWKKQADGSWKAAADMNSTGQ